MAKANLTDEKEIRECIARADFVRKGSLLILSFPCDKAPQHKYTTWAHLYRGVHSRFWLTFLQLMVHQRSKHCKLSLFPLASNIHGAVTIAVGCGHSADPTHPGTTSNDTEPCGSGTTERSTKQDSVLTKVYEKEKRKRKKRKQPKIAAGIAHLTKAPKPMYIMCIHTSNTYIHSNFITRSVPLLSNELMSQPPAPFVMLSFESFLRAERKKESER